MFSESVDKVVARSNRRERLEDVKAFMHSTIRECQNLAKFYRDRIEDEITVGSLNTAGAFVWDRPARFKRFEAVEYPNQIFPKRLNPGKRQVGETSYYYGGPTYFAFVGVAETDVIKVAYYTFARRFKYYAATARDTANPTVNSQPAIYDRETETWQYLDTSGTPVYVSSLGSTTADEAAQALVSNWLLLDWNNVLEEGALAKILKVISHANAPSSFALYKSLQKTLIDSAIEEGLGEMAA